MKKVVLLLLLVIWAACTTEAIDSKKEHQVDSNRTLWTGEFDHVAVHKAIRSASPGLNACYLEEVKSNPNAVGNITVQIEMYSSKKAHSSKIIGSTMHTSQAFQQCILSILQNADFPKSKTDKATVGYSIVFAP